MTTVLTPARPASAVGNHATEVLSLSPTTWRVSDPTLPEGDGRSVLGVVQAVGDTFEVTRIGTPLSRFYFGNLDEAVSFLSIR